MLHLQPSFPLRVAEVSLYLLPSLIALVRRTAHLGTGFAINLLLGWTVVGWMYSMAWAAFSDKRGEMQGEIQLALHTDKPATAQDIPHAA